MDGTLLVHVSLLLRQTMLEVRKPEFGTALARYCAENKCLWPEFGPELAAKCIPELSFQQRHDIRNWSSATCLLMLGQCWTVSNFAFGRCEFSSQILVTCGNFGFSAFIWSKLRLRLIESSQVLTVKLLLVKEHGGVKEKIFNDSELEALLAEDSFQMQEKLAESLGVTQQAILKRPKAMGIIQKQGQWVSYELNGVFLLVNSCFKDRIGRGFYTALWPTTKNGSSTIIPSAKNHGECPVMRPRRRPGRMYTVSRLCSAFGGTNSVWCIMSCWNRVKPPQGIGIERNWYVWA